MFILRYLPLVALAATSVVADFATVQSNLQTVDADIRNVTTRTNAVTGTGATFVGWYVSTTKLINDYNTTKTNTASTTFTETQFRTLVDYLNNTVVGDYRLLNTALRNKKATFQSGGYRATVYDRLQDIKSANDEFFYVFPYKGPTGGLQFAAAAVQDTIERILNDIIAFYSS